MDAIMKCKQVRVELGAFKNYSHGSVWLQDKDIIFHKYCVYIYITALNPLKNKAE